MRELSVEKITYRFFVSDWDNQVEGGIAVSSCIEIFIKINMLTEKGFEIFI